MFFRKFICCNHDKTADQVQTMDMISTNPVTVKSLSTSTSKQPTKDTNNDNKYKFCNTARNPKPNISINDLSLISIQSNHTNNSLFSIVNKLPFTPKQNEMNSNQCVNDTPTFKVPTFKKRETIDTNYSKNIPLKQTKSKQKNSCFSPNFVSSNNNNNISNSVKSFGFSYCEEQQ